MKSHNYFKKGFIVLITMLTLSTVCTAEEITLTTYYPSPYGVYSEMRLYPKDSPTTCSGTQRGLMYYDDSENRLKVCNGTPPYQDIGGGYWAASPFNSNNIYNTNSGNVGIGTNNPTGYGPGKSLHIFDPSNTNSGIRMQAGSTDVGIGTAASLNGMILGAMSNGPIQLLTNSSERMRIAANGNVGIGTTNPAATERLHVVGNIYTPNSLKAGNLAVINSAFAAWGVNGLVGMGYNNGFAAGIGQNAGGETGLGISSAGPTPAGAFYINPTVNEVRVKAFNGRSFNFLTSAGIVPDFSRLFIRNNDGFVGIGTTNPQETLHVNGDIFAGGNFFKSGSLWAVNTAITAWGTEGGIIAGFNNGRTIGLGQTGAGAYTGLGITSGSTLLASFYAGNEVGIGTYLNGPSQIRMWAEQAPGFAGADIMIQKNGNIVMRTQQMNRLTIDSLGNVFIPGNVNVSGAKNFKIPHPLDQEHKYLVHSCLEGPEAGVYYRGEGQLKEGIAQASLPEYFEALTRKDGRSVLLTNIDGGDVLYVETQDGAQVKNGKFIARSSNPNSSQRFNWEVRAIRSDIEPLKVEVLK